MALLLALRRQRLAERTQEHVEKTAIHERFTELYTKAVEQLGHERAAVRLGGLYALERVGDDNPDQRQTIVDVLSAYLRMPYPPQADNTAGESDRDQQQEMEVRSTAQRILVTHLTRGTSSVLPSGPFFIDNLRFWRDIDLDLTGAHLTDWRLVNGEVGKSKFDNAIFVGDATFEETRFAGDATFRSATFSGAAWFRGDSFGRLATFAYSTFNGKAKFTATKFAYPEDFWGARTSWHHRERSDWPQGWK